MEADDGDNKEVRRLVRRVTTIEECVLPVAATRVAASTLSEAPAEVGNGTGDHVRRSPPPRADHPAVERTCGCAVRTVVEEFDLVHGEETQD